MLRARVLAWMRVWANVFPVCVRVRPPAWSHLMCAQGRSRLCLRRTPPARTAEWLD